MESHVVLETCLKTYILHNSKLGGVVEWAAKCPWFHEPSQRKWMHHLRGIGVFIEQWCLCSHRALLCQLLYCQFLSSCRIQWKIYFASTLPTSFTEHPTDVFKIIQSLEAESWPSHTWLCLQSMQEALMNKSIVKNITLANPHSQNIQSRYKKQFILGRRKFDHQIHDSVFEACKKQQVSIPQVFVATTDLVKELRKTWKY